MFIRDYHCGRRMTYISMFRIHYKIYIHFSFIPFRTNIVYSVKVRTYVSNEKKNVQKHPTPRRTCKIDLPFPLMLQVSQKCFTSNG